MKAIKKLLNTTTKKIVAIALLAIVVLWFVLFFVSRDTAIGLLKPLLWTLLVVAVAWLAIHYGMKAWRKRKRAEFDEQIAAKEGIADRRREWSTWTDELEKQGIDRYELPFYLLAGEPQSGKSVMLHNSDLHFPFGQNRLSGVGGTRGCDWWFTEEAVILDLAGRLFTHEGGATDRLEFEAFLEMLYEFRPLCPANGVILVIPCDSLLKDDADQCTAKATKLQNALLSLTTKLQAQMPVYLVLTKGDQIFGFAESVHRLDVEQRHQMFGWSRPAEKLDTPFDIAEVQQGFDSMVERGRLLRAHMLAGARLPEALAEVDRLYAFPHELEGMRANLEVYVKRIFTASNITDRVFFRGLYLTSGLQSGVPIAKVCTELFGQTGEADTRNLEALFSKQRAYFIKDLVRDRIFGERGLVRPTEGRVQHTRRTTTVAYGISGVVVLASLIFAVAYLFREADQAEVRIDEAALEEGRKLELEESPMMPDLLFRLQLANDAVERPRHAYEKAYTDTRGEYKELYCAIFDRYVVPLTRRLAIDGVERELKAGLDDHKQLTRVVGAATVLMEDVDFSDKDDREPLLTVLGEVLSARKTVAGSPPLALSRAFALRADYGSKSGLIAPLRPVDQDRLAAIGKLAVREIEACLVPGARTQPDGALGFALAWKGAEDKRKALLARELISNTRRVFDDCRIYSNALKRIEALEPQIGGELALSRFMYDALYLRKRRDELLTRLGQVDASGEADLWGDMVALNAWFSDKVNAVGDPGAIGLATFGFQFGSSDAGQSLYRFTEDSIGTVTNTITLGGDVQPVVENTPTGLRGVADEALPSDMKGGALVGLGAKLRDLDQRVLGSAASSEVLTVFLAQCIELSAIFERELMSPAAVRAALGEDEAQSARSLSVGTVKELVSLHAAIKEIIDGRELRDHRAEALKKWQRQVETLLENHLAEARTPSTYVPELPLDGAFSPEAWDLLEALEACTALKPVKPGRLEERAAEVEAEGFLELAGDLLDRWRKRKHEIGETAKTVDELEELASGVKSRLGDGKHLAGTDFDAWASRVDAMLAERLGGLAAEAQRIWTVDVKGKVPLQQIVNLALDELETVEEKIQESEQAGLDQVAPVIEKLKDGGPIARWLSPSSTLLVLEDLRQWRVPRSGSEVESDLEYGALRDALIRLRKLGANEGVTLAGEYADRFGAPEAEAPADNAGIRLVRQVRDQFALRLRELVRESYLTAMKERLEENPYDDLLEVLFWEPGQDLAQYRDNDVRNDLDKLLKKDGAFDALRKDYRIHEGSANIAAELFPENPAQDEDEWAAVHRFLVDLQDFLLEGDDPKKAKVTRSKFSFWLVPETEASDSVWLSNERDNFYYPGDDSSDTLQRKAISRNMSKLRVSNWSLDVNRDDRSLLLLWSKLPMQADARTDPTAFKFEAPGSLGPLLLAWSGEPTDDDRLEFRVSVKPEGTSRPAPLKLEFDSSVPVPVRPSRP